MASICQAGINNLFMKIARHCCLILTLLFATQAFSQSMGRHNSGLISSSQTMHVHFDKDIYLPGETIWFKAYLYNINEISYNSTNFYVAIYDEMGKLIQQKQYPVLEGSSNGDFEIPDTIQSSRIQFRAFTKGMIIDDSNNVYERILTVYNRQNNPDNNLANRTINLQFFPEGGQTVSELQNYIAIKASYPDGSPAIVNGQIVEAERNKRVDTFFTNKMGLGKFILIPSPRKTYLALWKDESGNIKQTPLPAMNRYGVSFHAEVINKELQYTIAKNRSSDSLSMLHLLAQMGNYLIYKADLVVPNEMELSIARFPIDSLPPGLLQLGLFDKNWNILQERLVFISDPGINEQPLVNRDTINALPKGKNSIEIGLPDTMFTNLSASIADINFYDQQRTNSIDQEIWFSRQLKELNVNTDSILRSGDRNTADLITLTHDWKKYKNEKLIDKSSLKPELLDDYLSVTVKYKQKDFALPKGDALNLIINSKGVGKQVYNLEPSDQTTFNKDGFLFFDSTKIFYQMDKNKGLTAYLTISRDRMMNIPSSINALENKPLLTAAKPTAVFNGLETFYTPVHSKFNDVQTIKAVIVKTKYRGNPQLARIDELDKFYTTGMFSGTVRGVMFNIIDDTLGVAANNNLQDYLLYRIPGVKKYGISFGKDEAIIKEGKLKIVTFPVITFIDEVEMDQMGGIPISSLVLSDVAYVKYMQGIVIGAGFKTSHGALYVYTKKGTEKDPLSKGLPFVYIKGYNSQKEFTGPLYSDKTLLKEPDLRTTLYWNPNIIMDKTNNKIKIEYYNNDVSKKLLLTIEGINASGKLIHIEKIIE